MPEFLTGVLGQIAVDPRRLAAWRYTLMSGLIPAIPLILIRPFLPESPAWAQEEGRGHAETAEHRRAVLAGAAPHDDRHDDHVRVQLRGGVRCDPADAADRAGPDEGRRRSTARRSSKGQERRTRNASHAARSRKPVAKGKQLDKLAEQKLASDYTKVQEIGGLLGRFLLAVLAVVIVSRRGLLRLFQVPGLIFMPLFFWYFLAIENTKYFEHPARVGWASARCRSRTCRWA